MIVSLHTAARTASKAEKMIEAESAVAAHQPMIAEKPACRVADQDIGAAAGARPSRGGQHLAVAAELGARAGDAYPLGVDLPAALIVHNEIGLALAMPR